MIKAHRLGLLRLLRVHHYVWTSSTITLNEAPLKANTLRESTSNIQSAPPIHSLPMHVTQMYNLWKVAAVHSVEQLWKDSGDDWSALNAETLCQWDIMTFWAASLSCPFGRDSKMHYAFICKSWTLTLRGREKGGLGEWWGGWGVGAAKSSNFWKHLQKYRRSSGEAHLVLMCCIYLQDSKSTQKQDWCQYKFQGHKQENTHSLCLAGLHFMSFWRIFCFFNFFFLPPTKQRSVWLHRQGSLRK